MMGAMNMLF